MTDIKILIEKILSFRDARDWKKFHNPKDVTISLVLEANEVLEHFQWKNEDEIDSYIKTNKNEIGEELADVLYWVLLLSHDLSIDVLDALDKKIDQNDKKYPIDKVKGKYTKYDKL